ncbi:MAG TPA: hypothetical protein EYP36_02335 [Calditrichaeota bacterium]|nr:hypothetical protein [Calditrichota bacterium]
MKKNVLVLLLLFLGITIMQAQVSWKRKGTKKTGDVLLFHSTQVVNLPTAEVINKGELQFEVSHRFLPPVDADKAFLGLDGPAYIRLALGYVPVKNLAVTLGRSNNQDNYDLRIKYKFLQLPGEILPLTAAVRIGTAWNTEVIDRKTSDPKNFQYYGQAVLNTLLFKKLGIGVVPSYLYNSHIYCEETRYSFTLGSYLQFYISPMWSLLLEANNTVSGWRNQYDSYTFGFELETGGHFFKVFLTNAAALNPSQFLAGADLNKQWRLGFNLTRVLTF